ncbi:spore germination YkwD domain-containing protein [Halogranum gelatinilyticum]|nr:hypothetical protein [Halogranum gelatinilyticum]
MYQWMNPTGYRQNVLTPEWDDISVGIYIIENENGATVYTTQKLF